LRCLPAKQSTEPKGFIAEFYKTFKEELTSAHHKPFKKIKRERILSHTFHESNITLLPKPDKYMTTKIITDPYP
jgi:hypothetical protein